MSRRDNIQRTIGDDWQRLRRICERALEHQDLLESTHEWRFVGQMHERLMQWQGEAFVSGKQLSWLHRIDERIDAERPETMGVVPVDEAIRG